MSVKALDLFQASQLDKLPREGGCIVSSFLQDDSTYARYEVVAYNNVKALHLSASARWRPSVRSSARR